MSSQVTARASFSHAKSMNASLEERTKQDARSGSNSTEPFLLTDELARALTYAQQQAERDNRESEMRAAIARVNSDASSIDSTISRERAYEVAADVGVAREKLDEALSILYPTKEHIDKAIRNVGARPTTRSLLAETEIVARQIAQMVKKDLETIPGAGDIMISRLQHETYLTQEDTYTYTVGQKKSFWSRILRKKPQRELADTHIMYEGNYSGTTTQITIVAGTPEVVLLSTDEVEHIQKRLPHYIKINWEHNFVRDSLT